MKRSRRRALLWGAIGAALAAAVFWHARARGPQEAPPVRGAERTRTAAPGQARIPDVDLSGMEPRVARSIQEARERVRGEPRSAAAWGRLGIVLDAHELYKAALACYETAHAIDPSAFRWPYQLARILELQGADPREVVENYRSAARLRPDYAPLYVRLGDALMREAELEEAREAFGRAAELDPTLARAHRGLGEALLAMRRPGEALAPLERAAALMPEDGAVHAFLARALTLTGERERAREEAARAGELERIHTFEDPVMAEIRAAGTSSRLCLRRAEELMNQGNYRAAIADLRIALETLVEEPGPRIQLGRCLLETGRPQEAREYFEEALTLQDDLPDVQAQVGSLLAAEGRFEKATEHYRRAIELDPRTPKYRALLASSLAQVGRTVEALEEFARAAQAGELDAADQNNWGTLLARTGRAAEALAHFREATRLNPRLANARFNLGAALEVLGHREEAIEQYREAVRIDPRHRAAQRLKVLENTPRKTKPPSRPGADGRQRP